MIACIIEFGVREGRDDDAKRLLTELLVEVETVPGFPKKDSSMWTVRSVASRSPTERMRMHYAIGCTTRHMSARSGSGSARSSAITTSRLQSSNARRTGPRRRHRPPEQSGGSHSHIFRGMLQN